MGGARLALHEVVEQTVTGLGYELVEVERSAGGLLRVTIDLPWQAPQQAGGEVRLPAGQLADKAQAGASNAAEQFVTVEDCERVTRQLQFVLEVNAADYKRLEVSSPGIDRPLRREQDFERFAGAVIDLTLKQPLGASNSGIDARRKKFRGTLEKADAGWQIVWSEAAPVKPGQRVSKKRQPLPVQVLGFVLDEIKEARLAPIVNFKGRQSQPSV
jgi:ribosome maturation factor RimP